MSAPLRLTANQLREIADALDTLSQVRQVSDVEIGSYGGPAEIRHLESDTSLTLAWDESTSRYVVDDRVGG